MLTLITHPSYPMEDLLDPPPLQVEDQETAFATSAGKVFPIASALISMLKVRWSTP